MVLCFLSISCSRPFLSPNFHFFFSLYSPFLHSFLIFLCFFTVHFLSFWVAHVDTSFFSVRMSFLPVSSHLLLLLLLMLKLSTYFLHRLLFLLSFFVSSFSFFLHAPHRFHELPDVRNFILSPPHCCLRHLLTSFPFIPWPHLISY